MSSPITSASTIHPSRATALKFLEINPLSCQHFKASNGKVKSLIYWNGKVNESLADEKKVWAKGN